MAGASDLLHDHSEFFDFDGGWILEQSCISVGIVADGSVHRNHHPVDRICMSDVPVAVGFGQHRIAEDISRFNLDGVGLFHTTIWHFEPGVHRTVPETAGKEGGK